MKKFLGVFVLGIFFISVVYAIEITEKFDSNVIVKEIDSPLNFTLFVTEATPGNYNLYSLSDIVIEPSEVFEVGQENFEKEFTLTPNTNLDTFEGYYTFSYTLHHRDVEKFEKKATVKIIHLEDALEVSSESINQDSGVVSFYVENKEDVNLKGLKAEFSSVLFDVSEVFDLGPKERKTFSVNVDADKLKKTKAGVYIIKSVFETEKGDRKLEGNLFIGEKKGILTNDDSSGLLIRTQTVTKVNAGNVLETVEVKVIRNIFSRLFTSFNIEPTFTDREGFVVEYTWIKDKLGPTESFVIKAKTNYVLPFFVIVFAIVVIFGFKRYSQTKVEVTKTVSPIKTKTGEFALRIRLSMSAKKSVENMTLIDRVPPIVKIYKKFGMVAPDKIDSEKRRISWHVGNLRAGEERIFTYIVYSKVGVVGKFSLPFATAVFEDGGKIHEVASNQVFFMSDQIRGD